MRARGPFGQERCRVVMRVMPCRTLDVIDGMPTTPCASSLFPVVNDPRNVRFPFTPTHCARSMPLCHPRLRSYPTLSPSRAPTCRGAF